MTFKQLLMHEESMEYRFSFKYLILKIVLNGKRRFYASNKINNFIKHKKLKKKVIEK